MNVYIPYTRLPSAYQEVEYIQSSGSQYINTGYTPTTNTGFEIKYRISNYTSGYQTLLGTRVGAENRQYWIGWQNTPYYIFTPTVNYNSTISFNTTGTDHDLIFKNGTLSEGGNSVSISYSSTPQHPLYLFAGNAAGSASEFSQVRIYNFIMYEGNTLIKNLVPCYRKSDGVIGMYDIVNNQFYTNSGTGTFSKGNDVTMSVLKNIYIGEYKGYSVDFTTATSASLQADGFTTYGNLGLDSNGMYVSSGDNAGCGVYKAVDLTGCSKFTLKFYSSLTSGSWAGGPNILIGALSGSSPVSPYSWLNFRSNNNSGYCGEQLFYENSIIAQSTTAKSNGDYTTTIVYDFSNSTVSVTTTGPTPASYSASLSSAQVSALTQNRYVKFEIAVGVWSAGRYNRLKKVERIIE